MGYVTHKKARIPTMSDGEVISLDKERIMRLVRKAERLQGVIDKKK